MTTHQYKIDNFNITLSQIDDNIYIKIVDNISFQTYKNNIDFNDINLPFDKNDIFNIICDCFALKENFNVSFLIKENNIKITFDIIFNLKYKYNFNVILIEKNVKSELKTECQYIKEINDLKNEVKSLKDNQEKVNNELLETISILKSIHHNFLVEIIYIDLITVKDLLKNSSPRSYDDSFLFYFKLNDIKIKKYIPIDCESLDLTNMILISNSYHNNLRNLYNLKQITILPYYFNGKLGDNDATMYYDSNKFSSDNSIYTLNWIKRLIKVDIILMHKK